MAHARGKRLNLRMMTPQRVLAVLFLACAALAPARLFANNIQTAEHPAFGDKGYALQFDNRALINYSDTFVNANGTTRQAIVSQDTWQSNFRAFIPGWMLRVGLNYTHLQQSGGGRWGWGDTNLEAGASREFGNTRLRALLYVKAPTGSYDPARTVNIGSAQWDMGPELYLTQYLFDKKVDIDLYSLYSFRFRNAQNDTTPGRELCYMVTAAYLVNVGVPVRVGVEHRGLFGDPAVKAGHHSGLAKRTLTLGPVAQFNLARFVPGLSVWPAVFFDVENRNSARTTQYFTRLNYNF